MCECGRKNKEANEAFDVFIKRKSSVALGFTEGHRKAFVAGYLYSVKCQHKRG
jgi:hypothetical protein